MVPAFPRRLKEAKPRKGFIGDAEYKKLVANVKDLWLRTLIACAYAFGFPQRRVARTFRARQVGLIELFGSTRRNEERRGARRCPMTSEVFELLTECVRGKEKEDFVFTRPAGSHVVDPREEWYDLCVSSGLR